MIDLNRLKNELFFVEEKLKQISLIPKLEESGENYCGITINDDGILYNSETPIEYESGNYQYSFLVKWNEINEPIEYFEEKYKKEIEHRNERMKKNRIEKEKLIRKSSYSEVYKKWNDVK